MTALLPWKWIAAAVAVIAILIGVWAVGDRHGKAVVQAKWDAERAAVAEGGAKAQAGIDATHTAQEATIAKSDTTRTQELANEKAVIDQHRAPVAAGTERVRVVAAHCPARSSDVPQATGSLSPVDDAPVELSATGGQTVLDLRQAIAEDQAKIEALQDYARALQVDSP